MTETRVPDDPSEAGFSIRNVAIAAYGPTLLGSIGAGAVAPMIALSARDLGASVGVAALTVGVMGLGQLVGDLPAGALAARIGERQALLVAALIEILGMVIAFEARSVPMLFVGVFIIGLAGALFGLARQAWLTDAVPVRLRARALSTLGGVNRIGFFLGPFIGTLVVAQWGTSAAYGVGVVAAAGAFALVWFAPDITSEHSLRVEGEKPPPVLSVLMRHRSVLLTLGLGACLVGAVRAVREAAVPLWAESAGLTPAQVSLVFGIGGAVDMLLFYPSGWVMDRFGRVAVAVPTMVILGLGLLVMPLATTFAGIVVVTSVLGFGNGIGSGLIMTLGADASPVEGRSQFLGGWRLMADLGRAGGPLGLSGLTAIMALSSALVAVGVVALLGALWLQVWVPRHDPTRTARAAQRSRRAGSRRGS